MRWSVCMLASMATLGLFSQSDACTRALYVGSDNVVITGRTMDWSEDMHSDMWLFPRGMQRDSAGGSDSLKWTSKYGSVIVAGYNAGSADGMNEKGLVANMLYLAESDYGKPVSGKPILSVSVWGQYVLDNFGAVAEAVTGLSKEPFQIVAPILPNGYPAKLHLSISDSTGDSAIFEYIDGKQVIHHGKEFVVLTNSPSFEQQLAINSYWKSVGGTSFLPGTSRAADRFARASFFIDTIPKKIDPSYITAVPDGNFTFQALASVVGVMRSVSVPLGIAMPNEPNIASTLWRTVANQKDLIYCYDSATIPDAFWVEFKGLDFSENAKPKKLPLAGGKVYSGNVANNFVEAQPFPFLPASTK